MEGTSLSKAWYRRAWKYYNRPFQGYGFIHTVLMILFIWGVVSFLIPSLYP